MIADGLGRAVAFILAPGQAHELPQAIPLLERLPGLPNQCGALRAAPAKPPRSPAGADRGLRGCLIARPRPTPLSAVPRLVRGLVLEILEKASVFKGLWRRGLPPNSSSQRQGSGSARHVWNAWQSVFRTEEIQTRFPHTKARPKRSAKRVL